MNRLAVTILFFSCGVLTLAFPALATVRPTAADHDVRPLTTVDRLVLDPVDRATAAADDEVRRLQGEPDRFAIPQPLTITPETHGTWENVPDSRLVLWRLRLQSPGALSLNLGCDRFRLPKGGRLVLHPLGEGLAHAFTPRDQRPHGELWSPVILGSEMVVELTLPRESRHDYELRVVQVGKGYRAFGEDPAAKSGTCNIDVVCPQADPWRDEINCVAVYTLGGIWKCTGAMVNNTAGNGAPYFLTANHCGISDGNDHTMVVYWNFQSPACGDQGGGSLADYQTGAIFRAASATSDFCLVELEALPNPTWNVTYSGWSRAAADPPSAVAIHHPSTDEKSISFENDPLATTSYFGTTTPGNGTHLRVVDWDEGTTEHGSSGSPLYDPDHRIVGQLHGGSAACGNDLSDWYGRFSVSWDGGGSNATGLRHWLDPLGDDPLVLDLFDPDAAGLAVTPLSGLSSQGEVGGPFTPSSRAYTLTNAGNASLTWSVVADQPWIGTSGAGGTLAAGAESSLIVSLGPSAAQLPPGFHTGAVTFGNETTGVGDTVRPVSVQVGSVATVYRWLLNADPGWDREGQWEFGEPSGGGASEHGVPDPTAGHTGAAVFGYNLDGDYPAHLPEHGLTTGAIDCSGLAGVSLRFWRWLNVEQPVYDHAYIRASNDGASWTTIWENGSEVTDTTWQQVEYDLSAIADGESTVYVRWVMGITDGTWQYSGWNLDDVEIRGLRTAATPAPDSPALVTRLRGAVPNPFNPRTELRFTLARAGHARLGVHDARGRRVAVLHDAALPAGLHAVAWDGTDESGRPLGSGVYFARLEADGVASTAKLVLLK